LVPLRSLPVHAVAVARRRRRAHTTLSRSLPVVISVTADDGKFLAQARTTCHVPASTPSCGHRASSRWSFRLTSDPGCPVCACGVLYNGSWRRWGRAGDRRLFLTHRYVSRSGVHRSFLCLACFKDLLLHGGGSRKRLQSCGHWLTASVPFLAACMWMRSRRVLSLHDISDGRPVRRCSVSRLSDHDFLRCPIAADPDIIYGCTLNTCGKCSAACPVCDEKGHAAHTLKENVRRGIVP